VATVRLRYADREVVIGDLAAERDPGALDVCRDHADRMTPPMGWSVRDERHAAQLAV
jgi:hypothetical protein